MKRIKINLMLTFLVICCLLLTANARAATLNASSCSQSAVQSQVNAANNGDTVLIPTGSCTWSSSVSWTNKNINIIGAGAASTVITPTGKAFDIKVSDSSKAAFRISSMGFAGSPSEQTVGITGSNLSSPASGFRLDHLTLNYQSTGDVIVVAGGPIWGLIDHFNVTIASGFSPFLEQSEYLDSEYGQGPAKFMGEYGGRTVALGLGTANAVYVEDSTFNYTGTGGLPIFDSESGGGRRVFRHNTVTGAYMYAHWSRSSEWDGYKYEVYNNIFNGAYPGGNILYPARFESGTGVIYNNTFKNYQNNYILVDEGRGCGGSNIATSYACDGTRAWDGNGGDTNAPGWPCMGQIGSGCISGNCARGALDNVPLILWNNGTQDTCATGGSCTNSTTVNVGNQDGDSQDTCIRDTRNYIKKTAHTASVGKYNGAVDYSDGNNTMPTTVGTYSNTYKAYTYPHPLQGGTGSGTTPSPPSNLRIGQ